MPGYNHFPSCTCGWCAGGSSGRVGRRREYILTHFSTSKVSQTPQTDEARTYLIYCWWCGATVYYHTNGYGDSVLFDSLGSPWKIHKCWERYKDEKKKPKLFNLDIAKFKCLVLAGAIRKLQTDGINSNRAGCSG